MLCMLSQYSLPLAQIPPPQAKNKEASAIGEGFAASSGPDPSAIGEGFAASSGLAPSAIGEGFAAASGLGVGLASGTLAGEPELAESPPLDASVLWPDGPVEPEDAPPPSESVPPQAAAIAVRTLKVDTIDVKRWLMGVSTGLVLDRLEQTVAVKAG